MSKLIDYDEPCMQIFSEANYSVQSHGPPLTNMPPKPGKTGTSKMTIDRRLMWEPGTKLTVKFLDKPVPASDYVKGKIKQYAEQWKEFANIEFVWIKDNKQDAVVRISFEDDGYWSGLGRDILTAARFRDQDAPTMNLHFDDQTSEATFRRKTLHEFGHTMGLVHEQTNPNIKFKWNEKVVIDDMKESNGWTEEDVRYNFHNFQPYSGAEAHIMIGTSEWDGDSIMQYSLDPKWTSLNKYVKAMDVLSKSDKDFIAGWYPKIVKKASKL